MKDMGVGVKVWISWLVHLHFFTPLSPNWELPAYTRSWKQKDEYESHITAELEAFSLVTQFLVIVGYLDSEWLFMDLDQNVASDETN